MGNIDTTMDLSKFSREELEEKIKYLQEKNETLKALYEDARKEGSHLIERARNQGIDDFANFLHKKVKENNGLHLSCETRSWTHWCIFDFVNQFKESETKDGTK